MFLSCYEENTMNLSSFKLFLSSLFAMVSPWIRYQI